MGQRKSNIIVAAVSFMPIAAIISTALALDCFQCSSDMRSNCDRDPGEAIPCPVNDAGEELYCMVITEYDNQVPPSVFDNGSARKDKIDDANASDGEKKTNLTFLGRSCGILLGGDGCQVGSKNGKSKTVCRSYCNTNACNKSWQTNRQHAFFLAPIISMLLIFRLIDI